MTLHWWMHWFWVTANLAGFLASPLPSTTQDPRSHKILNDSTEFPVAMTKDRKIIGTNETLAPSISWNSSRTSGTNSRVAKAINSYDSVKKKKEKSDDEISLPEVEEEESKILLENYSVGNEDRSKNNNFLGNRTIPNNLIKREDSRAIGNSREGETIPDSEITWVVTTNKTPERRRKKNETFWTGRAETGRNSSGKMDDRVDEDLSVLPLRIESARFKLVVNSSRTITDDRTSGTRTFNGSEDIEIDQELAEPRLSATAASILQDFLTAGMSESTRLSRARNAFSSDFQRDDREEEEDGTSGMEVDRIIVESREDNNNNNRESEGSSSPSVVDIAAITGSCLATVVLISTMASLGFVMYRRKYLNPPQTLNSDKCSNPDSSGYIDDSTIRDNSEEMYSLDNDSFLNSLEAMTIQNYWTDSVKHTKL